MRGLARLGWMTRLIFLYGTMQPALAHGPAVRLAAALEDGRRATVRGSLHAVILPQGVYPVLWPGGGGRVAGQVFTVPALPGWLEAVDAYENCDPGNEDGSEYLRRNLRAALTDDGADGTMVTAQAYITCDRPCPDLPVIRHGDFARFLRETGLPPFVG